jgi:hypothetical protein
VEVSLLSEGRKISNMIFSLNFYQKDPVGGNREAATYQVYFADSSGKVISDVVKIIADKTSDNGQERTFRCQFNLKGHNDQARLQYIKTQLCQLTSVPLIQKSDPDYKQSDSCDDHHRDKLAHQYQTCVHSFLPFLSAAGPEHVRSQTIRTKNPRKRFLRFLL